MTAITIGTATATLPAKAPAKKSLVARMWDAFIESRMRQAEREIALYGHLLPGQFEKAGERLAPRSEKELPFVRS